MGAHRQLMKTEEIIFRYIQKRRKNTGRRNNILRKEEEKKSECAENESVVKRSGVKNVKS